MPNIRLGLEDELYYVRNGTINYYAMNFTVLVPAHMKELEFTWQAHQKSILYSWSAAYSSLAMTPPMFNISMQGEIPPRLETFRVTFPCTGTVSDDIKVVLQLNISLPHRHGVTSLNFQRNKICLKEEKREEILSNEIPDSGAYFPLPSPHSTPVSYQKPGWPTVLTNQDTIVRSDPPATVTFYVALGCACALIIILLTTMSAVAYLRNQKPPHMESLK
ncbi:hypothetical protein M8J77_014547 [Diaphorina citri]|nr:hypothetical protein M8J77_014547 [Diaphorina citri]